MTLFLGGFLAVYAGMHLYALKRIEYSLNFSRRNMLLLRWLMVFTASAPFLVRICEQSGLDRLARPLAWSGYCWMGFIFILVSALLTLDLLHLGAFLFSKKFQRFPWARVTCMIALCYATIATCIGFFEARNIRTEHLAIDSAKLAPSAKTVRIVQISDVHLGLIIREQRLREMLRIVNEARPDILVSTGDLLDGRLSRREGIATYGAIATTLAAITPPLGKYCVLGNHEYYAGLAQSLEIMKKAGFRVLRNESALLPNGLAIRGSDDPAWSRAGQPPPPGPDEAAQLGTLVRDHFLIYLKHRPSVPPQTEGLFDLQLSGHTHHGQIFPFYLITKLQYAIPSGTTPLRNGSLIHVSRGTGTWGPPIRFLAPPEITVIDIKPVADQAH